MASYLLKITLQGTPNIIWRRFVVPSFIPLNRLHEVIQTIMGWEKRHPHFFSVKKQNYIPLGLAKVEGLPEAIFSIDDIVFRTGGKLKYIYDPTGNKWVHHITIENSRYLHPEIPYPIYCIEGVRACPPESCNGINEFIELLKILRDPNHTEYNSIKQQYSSFDPDKFDIAKVNETFNVPNEILTQSKIKITTSTDSQPPQSEKPDLLYRLGQKLKKAI
jgi:hypothetical protein